MEHKIWLARGSPHERLPGAGPPPTFADYCNGKETNVLNLVKLQERKMAIEMIEEETFNQGTQIKVIGVGGGGGNAVEHTRDARPGPPGGRQRGMRRTCS